MGLDTVVTVTSGASVSCCPGSTSSSMIVPVAVPSADRTRRCSIARDGQGERLVGLVDQVARDDEVASDRQVRREEGRCLVERRRRREIRIGRRAMRQHDAVATVVRLHPTVATSNEIVVVPAPDPSVTDASAIESVGESSSLSMRVTVATASPNARLGIAARGAELYGERLRALDVRIVGRDHAKGRRRHARQVRDAGSSREVTVGNGRAAVDRRVVGRCMHGRRSRAQPSRRPYRPPPP